MHNFSDGCLVAEPEKRLTLPQILDRLASIAETIAINPNEPIPLEKLVIATSKLYNETIYLKLLKKKYSNNFTGDGYDICDIIFHILIWNLFCNDAVKLISKPGSDKIKSI